MSRLFSVTLAATAATTIAVAIGMSSAVRADGVSEKGALWSGIYVGVTGGYAFGNADIRGDLLRDYTNSASQIVSEDGKSDLQGGMIGGLVGFDYSLGNGLVIGAAGDLSWLNASGNADVEPAVINLTGSDYTVDTSVSWLGTVRGRVGFEVGNALFYGTGGVAFGGVDADLREDGSGQIGSDGNTQIGWVIGGGVNYMATESVMLGLEYLYVDLGDERYSFGGTGHADVDINMSIIRGTLGFRF